MSTVAIALNPDSLEHKVTLSVTGGAIERMEGLKPADDDYLPDPILELVDAINHSFFGELASASLHEKQWDADKRTCAWQLTLTQVPWETFKILVNLFCFFEPEHIVCQSGEPGAVNLSLDRLHFPSQPQYLPFKVVVLDEKPPEQLSGISLVFAQELSDEQAQKLISPLENWSNLVLMGAYKEDEENEPVVIPDGVHWSDAFTLTLGFSEAFDADVAAFNAVLHHACRLVKQGHPIASIEMR